MNILRGFLGYVVFALIVGFLMARASMRVLRNPDSAPVWLKWFLFPLAMGFEEDPDTLIGGQAFRKALTVHGFEARRIRLRYIGWTCLLLPLRVGWIVLVGGFYLLVYGGRKIWRVCVVAPGNKLFLRLTNL